MSDRNTRTPFERMAALDPAWASKGVAYWRSRRGLYERRVLEARDNAQAARMLVQWENANAAVEALDAAFLARRRA